MGELGTITLGVEELDIEIPGVEYLGVDLDLELDIGTPGVKI